MISKITKAIALFSGGLDSILATRLILEQSIEVEAVNFMTSFYNCVSEAQSAAGELGIKLKIFDVNKKFFKVLKSPKYGYGSNLNPCIDCHIFMFKKADEYMKERGAQFLISGEVLGERPMSQNKMALKIIEKNSGLEGLILRPLSAKLLEPTIPEREGLVDREKLLDIKGRSRKPQIQLAKQFGISNYSSPAGGCLLTDPGFTGRMRDLMEHKENFEVNDVELLKTGRHFRLGEKVKLIVGRNKEENDKLLTLAREGDLYFYPTRAKGPVGIGRGIFDKKQILAASGIIARYCDKDIEENPEIAYRHLPAETIDFIKAKSMEKEKLNLLRI